MFRKSNNRRKRTWSRDHETTGGTTTTMYPTDPAAIRRLNTQVNNRHWERKDKCKD